LENKAVVEGSFFYMLEDKDTTVLAVARSNKIEPPAIIELTGFVKNNFFKDWEIHNENNKQKRDT